MTMPPQLLRSDLPFFGVRLERAIAAIRICLAACSLFAIWFDPQEPDRDALVTYGLHGAYLGYAIVIAAVMWRRDTTSRAALAMYLTDIAVAAVFQYLTIGPSSPFFVFFTFALFSAALRWGWRGTLKTAGLVLVLFFLAAVILSQTLGPREFEISRFIIRITYLVLITIALVTLGQHEALLREEIRRLARWPVATTGTAATDVRQILEHAATIAGAAKVVVCWSENDEPWSHVVTWPGEAIEIERLPPDAVEPLVSPDLEGETFVFAVDPDDASGVRIRHAGGPVRLTNARIVHPTIGAYLDHTVTTSTPFRTEHLSGRIFLCASVSPVQENLPLIQLVGREIGASFEQAYAYRQSRQRTIFNERLRMAHDLHDGILQSLTGIRLAIQQMATETSDGQHTAEQLLTLERALAAEQGELRRLIEDLRPPKVRRAGGPFRVRLESLRDRISSEWHVPVSIAIEPRELVLPATLERSVPLMVHEAVINALKHGDASHVDVTVDALPDQLRIVVTDNGGGFPFDGRMDHVQLAASSDGPRSLRERVSGLGGQISIESSLAGSRVELSLPLQLAV